MKRGLLMLFALLLCGGITSTVYGQMTAAKRVPPAVEKKIELKADAEKVWEYASQPVNYKAFSGVASFSGDERALNTKIELTTKKGKKRSQHISFLDFDDFRICYFVTRSDYAGSYNWVYDIKVVPLGKKKCEVVLSLYCGLEELNPDFKKEITEEFDDIVAGLKKKFK